MVVVRASSAMPWASLAMQWTVAGATRMRSALWARATCSTASSDWVSNMSVMTGLWVRLRNVRGVMKLAAPWLSMTST